MNNLNNSNYDNSEELTKLYYLLYKLKNSEIIWIVTTSQYRSELKERIKNVSSDVEKYFIVELDIPYSQLDNKIKQFTKFDDDEECYLLYESK